MEIVEILSTWNKPVYRWVKREGGYSREKVKTADSEKTVMALVRVNGKKVTRHITVPK